MSADHHSGDSVDDNHLQEMIVSPSQTNVDRRLKACTERVHFSKVEIQQKGRITCAMYIMGYREIISDPKVGISVNPRRLTDSLHPMVLSHNHPLVLNGFPPKPQEKPLLLTPEYQ